MSEQVYCVHIQLIRFAVTSHYAVVCFTLKSHRRDMRLRPYVAD